MTLSYSFSDFVWSLVIYYIARERTLSLGRGAMRCDTPSMQCNSTNMVYLCLKEKGNP